MNLQRDWLWDKKISIGQARTILKRPQDKRFLSLAAILLSRKNTPKEVFKYYLKPVVFIQYWQRIKRQMRKDSWNEPRINYWQAIYDVIKRKYEKKGIYISKEAVFKREPDKFCKYIADKIKSMRKEKGLTQVELAKRLRVSQQLISRIEKGKENISLSTLKNIVDALEARLHIEII